jgi:hypothetical protein
MKGSAVVGYPIDDLPDKQVRGGGGVIGRADIRVDERHYGGMAFGMVNRVSGVTG